jgi:hypothetical protein
MPVLRGTGLAIHLVWMGATFGHQKCGTVVPLLTRRRACPQWRGLKHFLVAKLVKSFDFPCENGVAESLGDFRYSLSPRRRACPGGGFV